VKIGREKKRERESSMHVHMHTHYEMNMLRRNLFPIYIDNSTNTLFYVFCHHHYRPMIFFPREMLDF
jgi:hypothetical protein